MLVKDNEYNYLTDINNVKVIQSSSHEKSCDAKNIIDNATKTIWLSLKGLPQSVTFDLSQIIKKPKPFFQYWGIYCWHAYSTNPKEIELQCSADNQKFESLGLFQLHFKPGMQLFEIEQKETLMKPGMSNYIKIIVHKACGGDRTYINQLFLYDNFNSMNSGRLLVTPSKTNVEENATSSKKHHEIMITSENERYSSENNEEIVQDKLYDLSEENQNSSNVKLNENQLKDNHYKDNELTNLIKETESDIDIEPSDHNKILSALQHMKRIEKVFKCKRNSNLRGKAFAHSKEELAYASSKEELTCYNRIQKKLPSKTQNYFNSRTSNSQKLYLNYGTSSDINNYQKLERELNDLNSQLKSMNYELNYESVYSSNRTRATSNFNRTTNDPNSHYLYQVEITDRNASNINNNDLMSNNEPENEYNKDLNNKIGTRMDKIENKVINIEKEMGELKEAFINLNDRIEKGGESENNQDEENDYRSDDVNNGNYQEEINNNEDEELVNRKHLERGKLNLFTLIEINDHIDQKFDLLANKIESQIYDKFLKPSVKSFEDKVQHTMSKMKNTIKRITSKNSKSHFSTSSISNSNASSISLRSSKYKPVNSSNNKNEHSTHRSKKDLEWKYDKITELGEKLYTKLIEKQTKLEQSSQFLKQMLYKGEKKAQNH